MKLPLPDFNSEAVIQSIEMMIEMLNDDNALRVSKKLKARIDKIQK